MKRGQPARCVSSDPPPRTRRGHSGTAGSGLEGGSILAARSAGPRLGLLFVVVAIGLFVSSIDATVVATALPAIHRSLGTTVNWAGWTITIYSLGMVVVLPIAGKVSEQVGRRRVFVYGVAVFTVGSMLCGLATNIYLLIVFRAVQAVGGAALQPSAAGIVADHFGANRDRAIGMFGTIIAGGQVVGPAVGGLLVGYLSWRWIFFVNVPVGVALVALILRFIPVSPPRPRTRTDVRGLLLLALFVLSVNFGITDVGDRHVGVVAPTVVVPLIVGAALLYLFARHTAYTQEPFIPLRIWRGRGFAVVNTVNLLWGVVGFVTTLAPLYAQERYHVGAFSAGTLLAARGVGALAVGTAAAMALRRTGYRLPLLVGFLIFGLGAAAMATGPKWGTTPYIWLMLGGCVTGLGSGIANPASRNACLEVAPDDVAAISGLRQMFLYVGSIFSVSIVTAILNRSPEPGLVQARLLWVVVGILVVVMSPLVARVPEHRGGW